MIFKTEKEIYEDMIQHAVENGLITVEEEELDRILEGSSTENQYLLDLSNLISQLKEQTLIASADGSG